MLSATGSPPIIVRCWFPTTSSSLSFLTRPLTRYTSPAFEIWALNQNKVVSEFRFKTQHMDFSLIPKSYHLYFEEIIRFDWSKYKQLVDADDWNPGPGSATPAAEPTRPPNWACGVSDHDVSGYLHWCGCCHVQLHPDYSNPIRLGWLW